MAGAPTFAIASAPQTAVAQAHTASAGPRASQAAAQAFRTGWEQFVASVVSEFDDTSIEPNAVLKESATPAQSSISDSPSSTFLMEGKTDATQNRSAAAASNSKFLHLYPRQNPAQAGAGGKYSEEITVSSPFASSNLKNSPTHGGKTNTEKPSAEKRPTFEAGKNRHLSAEIIAFTTVPAAVSTAAAWQGVSITAPMTAQPPDGSLSTSIAGSITGSIVGQSRVHEFQSSDLQEWKSSAAFPPNHFEAGSASTIALRDFAAPLALQHTLSVSAPAPLATKISGDEGFMHREPSEDASLSEDSSTQLQPIDQQRDLSGPVTAARHADLSNAGAHGAQSATTSMVSSDPAGALSPHTLSPEPTSLASKASSPVDSVSPPEAPNAASLGETSRAETGIAAKTASERPGSIGSAAVSASSTGLTAPHHALSPPQNGVVIIRDMSSTPAELSAGETDSNAAPTFGAAARDPFPTLDSSSTAAGPTMWIHAGAQRAEAGYNDPVLGWVSVRADLDGGNVRASLVPGSADAGALLGTHLPGLNAYLAQHHGEVSAVTVSSPDARSGDSGFGSGSSAANHSGANSGAGEGAAEQGARDRSSTEPAQPITAATDRAANGESATNYVPLAAHTGGAHISVLA